jgi:peptidyl-prolyl cis-trans isomerase B (cyclophilin B)
MRRMLPSIALFATIAVVASGCGGSTKFSDATTAKTTPTSVATTSTAPATTDTGPAATSTTAAAEPCTRVHRPAPSTGESNLRPPTESLAAGHAWEVILDTNCGVISIDLDTTDSPKTAASFAALVRRGFFNNLTFHRIASQPDGSPFVIQGGDPTGTGEGGPGYTVVEPPPSDVDYSRGTVAMAKTSAEPPGASGSQFFIVTGQDAQLPAQYALLGHVSAGMGVVDRIAGQPTLGNEQPTSPIVIRAATLGEH